VLACAVEEGWIETNPALQTRKANYMRQWARLTKEAYDAIYEKAEPWLQTAMDLSLLTLLRREDIVSIGFADVHDGALWVVPGKTEGSTGARLRIELDGDLPAVIARCRDGVLSPYLIHRLSEKARPRNLRAKTREHHTQVLPEQLSRAFADARIAAGIDGESPPTFHEIRSLGGALLRESGWTIEQVQGG
jgi:integrase